MDQDLLEIYTSELDFMLRLKQAIGKLNNRIHDKLALIAIKRLEVAHGGLRFDYKNAGAAGIDIKACDSQNNLKLIAEVKTNLPDVRGIMRGPQLAAIERDLQRLAAVEGEVVRYLVVLSKPAKDAIERQLNTGVTFPDIRVFNPVEVDITDIESGDED